MRFSVAIATAFLACAGSAAAQEVATPWHEGHNSRVRLIAGNAGQPGAPRLVAGIEIRLGEGWKTYWRNPGESGGIPPRFEWKGSANLGFARVLYPAPERLKDALGDAIGYKRAVVFPVEIAAEDPARPVELALALEYGICREICVPTEVNLKLSLLPDMALGLPPELAKAMARVPRGGAERRPGDPELAHASAVLAGPNPSLAFDVTAAGGAGPDLFLEAPDGIFLPVPKRTASASEASARFVVDLGQEAEAKRLKGKTLVLTIVGPSGASEVAWTVE